MNKQQLLEKYNQVETTQDFIDLLEDPGVEYFDLLDAIVDQPSDNPFWLTAKINHPALDDISWRQQNPMIKSNERHRKNMTTTEYSKLEKNNLANGYDRNSISEDHKKIVELLGFQPGYSAYVNNQPPGAQMYRHVDSITCYTYENTDNNIMQTKFDKEKRQPVDSKPIYRCFVALDDWHEGQMFVFQDTQVWSHWKKGDVIFFDWQKAFHATANCGFHDRPLLKITGVVNDDSYIIQAKTTGEVAHL